MIKVEALQSLMLKELPRFNGIVYDGCWFYLTVIVENKIIKCNNFFHPIDYFETLRNYNYICYDSKEGCFWATETGDSSYIYKLNQSFQQIDSIYITIPNTEGYLITGISYNSYSDKIMLSYAKYVVIIDKKTLDGTIVFKCRNYESIKGVVDIFENFTAYFVTNLQDRVEFYNNSSQFIENTMIPSELRVISLASGYSQNNQRIHIYMLAMNENKEQCILNYVVTIDRTPQQEKYCSIRLNFIASEGYRIALVLSEESRKLKEVLSYSEDKDAILSAMRDVCKIIHQSADIEYKLYNELLKLEECCTLCMD